MYQTFRSAAYKIAPDLVYALISLKVRNECRRWFYDFQTEVAAKLYGQDPIRVLTGPFRGTRYFNRVVWGPITPKWLGSYEQQLHTVLASTPERHYTRMIDIGAAEGYYAINLARLNPAATVYAFDIDPHARKLQRELAKLNHVDNLVIDKFCSHATLRELLKPNTFVMCDIEGAEADLLDPAAVEQFKAADVLVEVHPSRDLSMELVRARLLERFSPTHDITEFAAFDLEQHDLQSWQRIVDHRLSPDELTEALNEHRSLPQTWLWFTVKPTPR